MKKKAIFLGGAFRDHQILYMIPILDGFCEQKKISRIIFEKKLSSSILKIPFVKKFITKNEILFLDDIIKKNFFLTNIILKITYFILFFSISYFVGRHSLLNKKFSWFVNQLLHSIWDTCIVYNRKSLNFFEFRSRIITSLQISQKILDIKALLKKNTFYSIIQHTVYSERFLFSLLRKFNIETYVQTKHVLIKQKKNIDFGFKYLDKKIFHDSYKHISNKSINKYWKNILKGKSKYLEARIASNLKNENKKLNIQENVIMLHIFKDSPFTNIDRDRIFSDYYSWVFETLKILKNSKEKWVIRKHPSSSRWGENQKIIVDELFRKVFGNKKPKNIVFENDVKSNLLQFKLAKRLITFSGNSHLEAACFGVRPIIIANTTLCDFDQNLFFKPKSLKEYKNFLLIGDTKKFRLSLEQKMKCKRILYLIHNVINYAEDINSFHVFRNEPKRNFKILFRNIKKKLNKNYNNMFDIGLNIGKKYNQSINKKYLKIFIK